MRRVPRILLVLPLIVMAAYAVGFRVIGEGGVPSAQPPATFGCVHRWDSSFECPQFNPQAQQAVRTELVQSIEITLHMRDGQQLKWTHPMSMAAGESGRNVDAVFFREPSVENFYISYLEKIEAPEAREARIREVRELLPQPPQ